MIVSHTGAFVFVAVPKTGSQSVRRALRPHLGPDDWEQCSLFEHKTFPVEALAALGHGHITCRELRPHLLPEMWTAYRKFAFVRDPLDRFRSLLQFWSRSFSGRGSLCDVGKEVLTHPQLSRHPLVRPQADFLCDDDGRLLVDIIGRYGELAGDFARILQALSLPPTPLEICNQSPPVDIEYDDELRAMIREFYGRDFSLTTAGS